MDPWEVKALAAACRELWAAVLELKRRDEQKEREKAEREAWRKTKWFSPASRGRTARPR
jgi:hypothetical protein